MSLTLWLTESLVPLLHYLSPSTPLTERAEMVLDPSCSPLLLERAARSRHLPLRHAAAQNRSTAPTALARLSTDVYSAVCEASISNPSTPTRALLNGRILSSPDLRAQLVEVLESRDDAADVVTSLLVEQGELSADGPDLPLEMLLRYLPHSGNE